MSRRISLAQLRYNEKIEIDRIPPLRSEQRLVSLPYHRRSFADDKKEKTIGLSRASPSVI